MTVHLGDSLIKMIDDRTGFFNLRTKIDLILGEGREAIIVDSGIDGDVGRRVIRALEEDNLVLKHIVLTHVYADHFGGAWFLKKRTGALVTAPRVEALNIENPIREALEFSQAAVPLNFMLS